LKEGKRGSRRREGEGGYLGIERMYSGREQTTRERAVGGAMMTAGKGEEGEAWQRWDGCEDLCAMHHQ
jgi:hypothetical protein